MPPRDPFKVSWRQFLPDPDSGVREWRSFRCGNWWGIEVAKLRRYANLLKVVLRLHRRLQDKDFVQEPEAVRVVREFLRREAPDPRSLRELSHPYWTLTFRPQDGARNFYVGGLCSVTG